VLCVHFDYAYLGMNKSGLNIVPLRVCNIAIVNVHMHLHVPMLQRSFICYYVWSVSD